MLSMKAKYAVRAVMVLAEHPGKMLQGKTIAKNADAPPKFLEAILLELKRYGIVESRRGIFGGYYLAKPAHDITIGMIVRLMDGMIAPVRCASVHAFQKCEDCEDEKTCVIRAVMLETRNAIAEVLDHRSIADMVKMQSVVTPLDKTARSQPVKEV
jgi:Rrf2 family protein